MFPLCFTLSATARPHNLTLRFKSSTPLRHFVCAVVMGRRRRTSQQSKEAASFGDTMHFANLLMERSDFLFSKLTTYLYSSTRRYSM
jgi:hypothetical protein